MASSARARQSIELAFSSKFSSWSPVAAHCVPFGLDGLDLAQDSPVISRLEKQRLHFTVTRKSGISAYLMGRPIYDARQERVSGADQMSGKYLSRFLRRLEQQWVERIQSLRQLHGQILQRVFDNKVPLIPIPVRTIDRRRLDQRRSDD